jgi:hypothetical protein
MKVILETADELLEAFNNLPYQEKQIALIALKSNDSKSISNRDKSLNALDFFGMWQGELVDVAQLRKEAWKDRT